MAKRQRIRDPLHDLIEFDDSGFEQALWRTLCTRPFQRLRRIKQLGLSELVFPGATHTRFAHSVGVFHTAKILMEKIKLYLGGDFNVVRAQSAIAAALLHDIGHGPFSHAFETASKHFNTGAPAHEFISARIIKETELRGILDEIDKDFSRRVASRLHSIDDLYGAVVSSQFDADRLDYMRRDTLMTGSHHSKIDFQWLMHNIEVGCVRTGSAESEIESTKSFVLGRKAIFAAEAYVLSLFHLYPTIYFHKTTRGAEVLLGYLLKRLFQIALEGRSGIERYTGLPATHALIKYAGSMDDLELFVDLDDFVVWGALHLMRDAQDEIISEFAYRMLERRLFQCVDIGALMADKSREEEEIEKWRVEIKTSLESKISEEFSGRVFVDEGERNPYHQATEDESPLNQIMVNISQNEGRLIDLGAQSNVVKALRPFRFFRVYYRREDAEARKTVEEVIKDSLGGL